MNTYGVSDGPRICSPLQQWVRIQIFAFEGAPTQIHTVEKGTGETTCIIFHATDFDNVLIDFKAR